MVFTSGETAQFNATASGINKMNFEYQWKKRNGNSLPKKVSGANETTLKIPNVTESDEGQYYCTVTNEWGNNDMSGDATLTVFGMYVCH